jgi:hypothetical protein
VEMSGSGARTGMAKTTTQSCQAEIQRVLLKEQKECAVVDHLATSAGQLEPQIEGTTLLIITHWGWECAARQMIDRRNIREKMT